MRKTIKYEKFGKISIEKLVFSTFVIIAVVGGFIFTNNIYAYTRTPSGDTFVGTQLQFNFSEEMSACSGHIIFGIGSNPSPNADNYLFSDVYGSNPNKNFTPSVAGTYYGQYKCSPGDSETIGLENWNVLVEPTPTPTPTPTPLVVIFDGISTNLATIPNNITNNLGEVTSENVESFSGLYFEKSVDGEKMGRITFNSALDLSSQATQDFMQNLMTYVKMGSGSMKFDARTVEQMKNAGAEIKMYNLNKLGYSDAPPIIVRNDFGNIISQNDPEYPSLSDQTYSGDDGGTFTFNTNHLTQFDLPDSADVTAVSVDKNALTDDSIKGENLDLSNISVALATLPLSGSNGSSISWESGDTSIISNNGQTVNRPDFVDKNTDVILTATVTKGLVSETKIFTLTVLEIPASAVATVTSVTYFVNNGASTIINVPSGTSKDVFLATLTKSEVNQTWDDTMIDNPVVTGNTLTVTAQDGSTAKTYAITVLTATQTTPDSNTGIASINSATPQAVIINPTQAVNIVIADDTTNPTIDVSSFVTDGTGSIPQITITSGNISNATIAIPATTVTSASSSWNGIIAAPIVTTITLPETSGETKTLNTAIELGFTGAKLSFDKAVRILLPTQAGKRVGYTRRGAEFTEIISACAADDQATGDALAADGDCKINIGSDLVIWTKHFTIFATYTQTPTPTPASSNSGGGGGGIGEYINGPLASPTPQPTLPLTPLLSTHSTNPVQATPTLVATQNITSTSKTKALLKIAKASPTLSPTATPNQSTILAFRTSLQKATIIGTIGQTITSTPGKFWSFVSNILRKIK